MKYAALIAAALFALLIPSRLIAQVDAPRSAVSVAVTSFGLNEAQGWVVMSGRLYAGTTGGESWREITPQLDGGWNITAADFAGRDGWAVALNTGRGALAVWGTRDGGAAWTGGELALYRPGAAQPPVASAFIDFVDREHGWLVAQHVTSANFSSGDLFATTDGGASWERRALPLGEPVYFTSPDDGWIAGGPTGEESYRTTDGGRSWHPAPASRPGVEGAEVAWTSGPEKGAGWRVENQGVCAEPGNKTTCQVRPRLMITGDGGRTWKRAELPEVSDSAASPAFGPEPSHPVDPRVVADLERAQTEIVQDQGFDKCEVASLNQLVDWYYNSPYRVVNVYVGGSSRACSNRALTAAYLRQIQNIGWRFIPTWVGKQAPCFAYTSKAKMSWDPDEALIQGIEEANWASDRLAELDLSDEIYFGSVAYYDIEYYNYSDAACHNAVKSFVTGWSAQMRARGNVAGVYSTGSIISGFANLPAPPDVIWPANWVQPYYFRPDASVWNVYGLSNSLWVNHQRIRQYTGGHNETWGTTTLNIDSNVLDGVVARVGPAPTEAPTPTPTVTPTPSITPTPWEVLDRHRLPLILR